MGDEFGGLGDILLMLVIFITVGSTMLVWVTGFALRRASERRRRQFAGEEPLPPLFGWTSQEDTTLEEPQRDDNQDMLPPDLEALIFGDNLPMPPDTSEARDGEVISPQPSQSASINDTHAVTMQINELPEDATEVLRVYRDLNDGKLIFEMKDHIFSNAKQIEGTPLAGRFTAIVDEMLKIETGLRFRQSTPPPPSMTRAASLDEDAPEPTIGDQIQDFLQYRLSAHPEFADRRIHIRPSLHGSITIEVDGHFYDAVADIPDGRVQAFLQKTIQDWSDHH
jgi:hypothetical protein